MISVVIPLYNKERQIVKTLHSVLQQSFQDFEIVVVNDGSTDGSVAAAESVQDERIRIIHQDNAGVSAARNRGIEEARYEFIAFLDADDRWKPDYLQTQYELTQKYPECSVFACDYEFVRIDGSVHSTIIRKLPFEGEDGLLSNYFEVASCSHSPICSISIMVRKGVIQSIGGFPIGIKSGEDLLTWAKLACCCSIAYSKNAQAQYIATMLDSRKSKAELRLSTNDPVLEELLILLERYRHQQPYLHKYVYRWIKIQTVIALEAGNKNMARRYAWMGMKHRGVYKEFIPLVLFAYCPHFLVLYIINKLKHRR